MPSPAARRTVDWGHLVFLIVICGAVLWYLLDAVSVSTSPHNLLLIAPLSVAVLVLAAFVVPQCFKPDASAKPNHHGITMSGTRELRSSGARDLLLIGGVAASLGAYVFLLNVIGFDIATWLFGLAVMFTCGERRPLPLVVYPLAVAIVLIAGFHALLPFPMYTVIL
jgi:hypothetical protein